MYAYTCVYIYIYFFVCVCVYIFYHNYDWCVCVYATDLMPLVAAIWQECKGRGVPGDENEVTFNRVHI